MSTMLMGAGTPGPPSSESRLYRGGGGGGATKRQSSPTASPLQLFVRAKKRINDIYAGMDDYVADVARFIAEGPLEKGLVDRQQVEAVVAYQRKVKGIRDVLARDHMKVAFFGRTSNGKSSVINAMLRDKVLPSGMGHTTNCFLQVEGGDGCDAFLTVGDDGERRNVESVSQLGHALHKEKLDESAVVFIHWPQQRCHLLRDGVVFVDSPGIDVSQGLDDWIDTHCLDADVFVLVSNAESTLMKTEKNFFHKVSERLSNPNIFVLQNRWDQTAGESDLAQVRQQHLERTVAFLADELAVTSRAEAEQRVFFVSARECLQQRLWEAQEPQPPRPVTADGFQSRYFEFQEFERRFEECISQSAVSTKFQQHTQRGTCIAGELQTMMEALYGRAMDVKAELAASCRVLHDRINFTDKELNNITGEMKDKIYVMTDDVERKVAVALSEEIRRLSVMVDEFSAPFHPDPLVMNVYKKELHNYVEAGLGSNLKSRLSTAVAANMASNQRDMTERMVRLVSEERRHLVGTLLPRREPFQVLYRLNCDNLCSDFQENIEFRFTMGITSLVRRFLGSAGSRVTMLSFVEPVPRGVPLTPRTPSPDKSVIPRDDLTLFNQIAVASVTSQGTVGGILLAGFLMKTVGWRLIAVTAGLYGALYLYERLTYTASARERRFKEQYVDHATRKLRLIVDLTSSNCSHQVQQELTSTFARLCHLVDETVRDMQTEAAQQDCQLTELERLAAAAKTQRNKASYIATQLRLFSESFLTEAG